MQQSRKQQEKEVTPIGLALKMLEEDYTEKDKDWIFGAINILQQGSNAVIYTIFKAIEYRKDWLERKL
jgi:hypothetical protein